MAITLRGSFFKGIKILTSSCTIYISIGYTEGPDVHLQPEIWSDYCVEASLVSHTLDWFVDNCTRASKTTSWR